MEHRMSAELRVPHFEQLVTERLVLRRFGPKDIPALVAYRSDPEVARYQGWQPMSETDGEFFLAWLRGVEPGTPGHGFQFAVTLAGDDQLIGDVYFTLLHDDARQAEIGYTFARHAQRQGYASEAASAVLAYAFDVLQLHRVIGRCATANTRSAAVLERIGMRYEGTTRSSFLCRGEWVDEHLYAILHGEWRAADR
jgi:RimJ/RimL family protein N-acetyltransferase